MAEVKAGAKTIRAVGGGAHGGKPGPGRPKKTTEPAAVVEPPFVWTRDDVEMVLGGLFDWPYALLGVGHRHWLDAKEKAQTAYDKLAWAFNKFGLQSPAWTIALTAGSHVVFQLLYSAMKSWSIVKAEQEAEDKKKKAATRTQEVAPPAAGASVA